MNFTKNFEPAMQGELDGFCGLYSLVNFFARREDLSFSKDRKRFKRIFSVAIRDLENRGHLNSTNVRSGLWQGILGKIGSTVAEEFNHKIKIRTLSDYSQRHRLQTISELVETLTEGEAALINMREPGHWGLAFRASPGRHYVDDPAEGKVLKLDCDLIACRSIELNKGLVFTNAQTH